jgi:hypothetical protein
VDTATVDSQFSALQQHRPDERTRLSRCTALIGA